MASTPHVIGVGSTAGFLGSLVGLGGGFVAIPMLTGVCKLTQHQAHGTSLAAVTATGAAGAVSYGMVGSVDWLSAGAIALGGIASAPFGARFASRLPSKKLALFMGFFQLGVGPLVPLKPYLAPAGKGEPSQPAGEVDLVKRGAMMAGIGSVSGFMAGLFGVGGGAVVVPAVTWATEFSHHTALGTSLAAMILPSLSGTLTHMRHGNVVSNVALPLALGTALGASVGANIVSKIDEEPLRIVFGVFMMWLGVRTIRANWA
eukprot:Sspe_Gene.68020::Locus_40129_Transcript_1_1_Confidence_1.000_Length_1057::g.68020::m.68020/K07090/K07090; uncharacterized protein